MPTEGLEPPWPDYKTGTLPIKQNRLNKYKYSILFNIFNSTIFINYFYSLNNVNIGDSNIKIKFKDIYFTKKGSKSSILWPYNNKFLN